MAEEKNLVVKLAVKSASYSQQIKAINQDTKLLKSEFDKASKGSKDFEQTLEGQEKKLKMLSGELENTKRKTEVYTTQVKNCEKTLEDASKAFANQQNKVKSIQTSLENAKNTYGVTSKEVKELETSLKQAEKALESKRNSVLSADSSLKNMQITLNKTVTDSNKLENEIKQLDNALEQVGTEASKADNDLKGLSNELNTTSGNATQFGANMAIVGQGLVEVGQKAGEVGREITGAVKDLAETGMEYQASIEGTAFLMKGLDQTTQDLINTNSQNGTSLGMTQKQYTDAAVKLANYQKTMGFTSDEINNMSASTIQMVADLAAVQDVPFDDAMKAYQSATKGNYEAMDILNVALSANTLENTAYIKSLGKSWKDLSENEKMTAIYLETQRQAGSATGLAAQEAGQAGMQYKLMGEEIKDMSGTLGSTLLPLLEPLIAIVRDVVVNITNWAKENPNLASTILAIIAVIGGLLAIFGPIISAIGMAVITMGAMSTAFAAAGGVVAFFSATILPVVAVIGAIIAIVIALFMAIKSNWEGISNATKGLFEVCKPAFDELKLAFTRLWETAVSIYDTVIQPLFYAIGVVIQKCIEYVGPIIASLMPLFTSVFNLISTIWESVLKPVFTMLMFIVREVWKVVEPCMDAIAVAITGTMSSILEPIQWVIDKLSELFSWIGEVGSGLGNAVGGFLDFINPFSLPEQQIAASYSVEPYSIMPMNDIAMSGSYYGIDTKMNRAISQAPSVNSGQPLSGPMKSVGTNSKDSNKELTDKLDSLIGAIADMAKRNIVNKFVVGSREIATELTSGISEGQRDMKILKAMAMGG